MSDPTETVDDLAEDDNSGFTDSAVLMNLREMISDLLTECTDAKTTGNDGFGLGSADVEFEMHGVKFNISISLSEEDETEH